MQTLQQQRATHALREVQRLVGRNDTDKLKTRASELPYMIHANGLVQAAAFFKSKVGIEDKDGYGVLYGILADWLAQAGRPYAGNGNLMAAITESDFRVYRAAQAEAMQYMDWVKKFAKAYL